MAATDARPVPKKNTAYRHYFCIRDNTGAIVTGWTAPDSEISQDGGTMADATNEATEIATSSGCGYIDLTAAEMNNDAVVLKVTVTNTDARPYVVTLFPEEDGDIEVNVTQVNGSTGSAQKLGVSADTMLIGTVDNTAFTPTTTEFECDDITIAEPDDLIGRTVIITSGTLQYQATDITDYALTTGRGHFTVTALTQAPANDVTLIIV